MITRQTPKPPAFLHVVAKQPLGRARRLALAAVLAALAGCSASGTEQVDATREALFGNDKAANDHFIGKGLTNFQAAGVVGNLDQESGVDPTIHQAGGGVGRGIAQWSTGARWDTTNNDNVLAFATQKGQSATSLGLQLDFMWYELTTFPEYGLAELKASTDITQATTAVEDKFEGCVYANYPECALPSRLNFAKGILKAYGADTGQGGAGGGGATGTAGAAGTAGASPTGAAGASTAGTSSAGASAGAGAGGTSTGGSSPTAGTPSIAGALSSGGTSSTGGAATVAGAPSVAGSPSAAGAFSAAGSASTAGTSSVPGVGLTNTSNDSSCAFAPGATGSGSEPGLCLTGLLLASTLGFRRRRAASKRRARSR